MKDARTIDQLRTVADLRRDDNFSWCGGDEMDDWLVTPFGRNRDSCHLTVSNHETVVELLKAAEPEGADDYQVLRFGHWACGWVDQVVVRPGTPCATVIEEQMARYESCPVLDDEDFSRREDADYRQSWVDYGHKDFLTALGKAFDWDEGLECVRDLVMDVDAGTVLEFYEGLVPSGEYCIHESSGCSFGRIIEGAVDRCTRNDLAAFVRKVKVQKDQRAADRLASIQHLLP